MNSSVQLISIAQLSLVFLPVAVVAVLLHRWSFGLGTTFYAMARMLVQLLLVGYVLTYIFETRHAGLVILVLTVMLFAASWIALRPLPGSRRQRYIKALASMALGGGLTLALVSQGVLALDPWFEPRYMVPLGGMIFSNAMNTVSLAAERFEAETANQAPYELARRTALEAAFIPLINSLFAVGLVALPGMMTGQILSGVSPLIAVRYQIMVMSMTFGSAGIAAVWLSGAGETTGVTVQRVAWLAGNANPLASNGQNGRGIKGPREIFVLADGFPSRRRTRTRSFDGVIVFLDDAMIPGALPGASKQPSQTTAAPPR